MKLISQLLLTFLLNACWQIAFIAAAVALCAWLLRTAAKRYQHLLWVSALVLSLCLPLGTGALVLRELIFPRATRQVQPPIVTVTGSVDVPELRETSALKLEPDKNSAVKMNRNLGVFLLSLYGLFLAYRVVRFFRAWQRTRAIKRGAHAVELTPDLQLIIEKCQRAFLAAPISLLSSAEVPVPITVGFRKPLVIMPEQLLRDRDPDLLSSAIGHEIVHVRRRDYFLNLIYEFLYLPLSFHPGAALVRRRINQTRELLCDELVAERLLKADVYARSLVRLAGSAPLRGLAPTTTVGIADADILEVRIMSLLKRSEAGTRGRKLLLLAVSLILAVPCIAAAALTFPFDFSSQSLGLIQPQDDAQKEKQREEKRRAESEEYQKGFELGREEKEMRERAERDPKFRAELEERSRHEKIEMEARAKRTAALASLAKVSMDQAIQIALSQQGGKVLECSLIGEHWEAPGKLAKDGQVLYHVVIFSGDEANPVTTHVLVNAIDGSIINTERERARAPITTGTLNEKALVLPNPEYPLTARTAGVSGSVAVAVTIDEAGNVISAKAISGDPLLRAASVTAAQGAQFAPTKLNGEPVKVKGVITYNFVRQ